MKEAGKLTVRIPPPLLELLDQRAELDYPSRVRGQRANRSQVILDALESYLCNNSISPDERLNNLEIAVNELRAKLESLELYIDTHIDKSIDKPDPRELTTAELARLIGKAASTVSRWSTGKSQPPEDLNWKFDPIKKLWINA